MSEPVHRRFLIQRQSAIPRLSPGSQFDARGFGVGYDGYLQPDQINGQAVRERSSNVAALSDIVDSIDAINLPPQLKQTKKLAFVQAFGVAGAQLLIPQNPLRRFAFIVSNFLGKNNCLFSYGKPIDCGAGVGEGIPLGGAYYQEANGSCSIDDIWVFCNDPAETYPFYICGYEAGIEIGPANRR